MKRGLGYSGSDGNILHTTTEKTVGFKVSVRSLFHVIVRQETRAINIRHVMSLGAISQLGLVDVCMSTSTYSTIDSISASLISATSVKRSSKDQPSVL